MQKGVGGWGEFRQRENQQRWVACRRDERCTTRRAIAETGIYMCIGIYIEGTSNFGRYIMTGYVKTESRVSPRLDPPSQVFGCIPRPVPSVVGLAQGRGLRTDRSVCVD